MAPTVTSPQVQELPKGVTNGVLNKLVTSPKYKAKPVAPKYPRKALRKRQEGTAWIRILVSADGVNTEIVLHKSSGFESLDEAALKAVRLWHFEPSLVNGLRFSSWVEVPVIFTIRK
ncbi:MAG: energy transducer TonB [Neptuniibacter sp.]